MSEAKGRTKMKRFFVQAPEDAHKRLQHLAIDRDTSAEKLAGMLLLDAIARAEAEEAVARSKRKPN